MARTFFASPVLRMRLGNLCPESHREAMDQILVNDLTILRLMNCDYTLLPEKIARTILNEVKLYS